MKVLPVKFWSQITGLPIFYNSPLHSQYWKNVSHINRKSVSLPNLSGLGICDWNLNFFIKVDDFSIPGYSLHDFTNNLCAVSEAGLFINNIYDYIFFPFSRRGSDSAAFLGWNGKSLNSLNCFKTVWIHLFYLYTLSNKYTSERYITLLSENCFYVGIIDATRLEAITCLDHVMFRINNSNTRAIHFLNMNLVVIDLNITRALFVLKEFYYENYEY